MQHRATLIGIVLIGGLIRLLASTGDLWFDEIWSLELAQQIQGPQQIIGQLAHDNNHPLNTLWMYLIGPMRSPLLYRLPVVLCGTSAVWFACVRASVKDRREAVITAVLMAASFFLIQYSSEARGYGYEILMIVLVIDLIERLLNGDSSRWLPITFSITCCIGILAHASFILSIMSVMPLLAWASVYGNQPFLKRKSTCVLIFGVPIAAIVTLWLVHYGRMEIGGGGPNTAMQSLIEFGSIIIGGPLTGTTCFFGSSVAAALVIVSFHLLIRNKEHQLALFYFSLLGFPIGMILVIAEPPVYPRYFLVQGVVILQLFAKSLSHLARQSNRKTLLVSMAVALLVGLNSRHVYQLLKHQRGGYSAALTYIRQRSIQETVTIGSDHDFRNRLIINYLLREQVHSKPFQYFENGKWPTNGPEWVILHDTRTVSEFPFDFRDAQGNVYEFRKSLAFGGLSGWHWAVYKNRDSAFALTHQQRVNDRQAVIDP